MEFKELIEKAKNNDNEAISKLKELVSKEGEHIALKYSDNIEQAQAILSETYQKAFSKLDELVDPNKFESWFYQIENKIALKDLMKRKQVNKEIDEEQDDQLDLFDIDDDIFEYVIDDLPEMEQRIASMYYREGMSIEDISDSFGVDSEIIQGNLNDIKARMNSYNKGSVMQTTQRNMTIATAVGAFTLGAIVAKILFSKRKK